MVYYYLFGGQFDASYVCNTFDMSSKGGESHAVKQPLEPSFMYDGSGCYISVTCNGNKGQLYLDKFDGSKRLLGKCILFHGTHYTPPEFESYCGKKWRQSLMHLGKPLCDYNLTCPPKQGNCSLNKMTCHQVVPTTLQELSLIEMCCQGTLHLLLLILLLPLLALCYLAQLFPLSKPTD